MADDLYNTTCVLSTYSDSIDYSFPISVIRIVTSLLSVVGSVSIIIGVFLTGKLSHSEVHPLFTLSVSDFIISCIWIFGGIVWIRGKAYSETNDRAGIGLCYVLAIATSILSITTYLLTLVYAAHALFRMREIYKNRGRQNLDGKGRWWQYVLTALMYILCWTLPAIIVIPVSDHLVGLDVVDDACWCFVDFFNTRPDNGNRTVHSKFDILAQVVGSFNGISYFLSSVLIVILYAFILHYAWKIIQLQRSQLVEPNSNKIIKKLAARAFVFIAIFLVCGFPGFLGSILVWKESRALTVLEKPDLVVLFLQAFLAPLQGILNAVFYGWSRKEFRKAIKIKVRVRMRSKRDNVDIGHNNDNTSESAATNLINNEPRNSRKYSS